MVDYKERVKEDIGKDMTKEEARRICEDITDEGLQNHFIGDEYIMTLFEEAVNNILQQVKENHCQLMKGDIVRDKETAGTEYKVLEVFEQDPQETESTEGKLLSSYDSNKDYLDSEHVIKVMSLNEDMELLIPSKRLALIRKNW